MLDDAPAPACTICLRALYENELGHQACRPCTDRVDHNLRSLAGPEGLYARLTHHLRPGSSNGGPAVSGSRTAPLPVRLEPLSLAARGGVVTILQTWLVDWHDLLGYRYPRWEGDLQQQCDQAVHRLRTLLPWAAEAATGGEKPPRRVPVQCGCGQILRVTLDTAGVRCPACETQYGHSEALQLPLAERRAA
jgi:hypothetical protein